MPNDIILIYPLDHLRVSNLPRGHVTLEGLGGRVSDSLYPTQFHGSLCLCVTDTETLSEATQLVAASIKKYLQHVRRLAVSVREFTRHFISSAADNSVTMQIAANNKGCLTLGSWVVVAMKVIML